MYHYLEEVPIHNVRSTEYMMTLSIYPVVKCGSDLQKGSPLEVTARGEELYRLKMRAEELVLSAMSEKKYSGKCFVEMLVEKNGSYCERDEWWVDVDLVEKKVVVVHE